jgi:hypothetical protein
MYYIRHGTIFEMRNGSCSVSKKEMVVVILFGGGS